MENMNNKEFEKIEELCDSFLANQGIKVVSRLQCIRCGAHFTCEQMELLQQHLCIKYQKYK